MADHDTRPVGADQLLAEAAELVGPLGMSLAMLVATDEEASPDADLKLRYVFEPAVAGPDRPLADRFLTLVVSLDPAHPAVPSLTGLIPAASWHEREAQDLFGIVSLGHPDPRPLVLHDGWPEGVHPMRKSFDGRQVVGRVPAEELPHLIVEGEGVFEIPVGPIHAGIIEPGHFRFSSVGETVLHLDARLFYTHRGLEKRIEGMSWIDGFHIAERLCGVCSVAHGLGYCEAVEQIAGVAAPARARVVRAIALELERLYNHTGDIGNICAGASYHYGTSAGLRIKEGLQRLNEQLAGNRFLRGWLMPGGIQRDLEAGSLPAIESALRRTEDALAHLTQRIDTNPTVVDRLDDTGLLSRQAAVDLATTGVAARASGVNRDARRDHPHAAFAGPDPVEPRVVTDDAGDVNARRRVRALEAHESIRLVRLLVARLEPGPILTPLPDQLPPWRIGLASTESPRGASIHWLRSDASGRIDRYHVRSASYANWPAVPLAAQTAIVPDFPLVNKSFELCYACTDR
ncbi:MAG TPA: NADH-quinone oxidoreductase subunit C [Candidatus Acidoferrum sp.]|nr:NADH-quinone oxidoreductase subunit C [Candidatus Acidoferrum sp.]